MNKDIITIEYNNDTTEIKVLGFTQQSGDKYILEGECSRCGQCCLSRCNHLTYEEIDGKKLYTCTIHSLRPTLCAIWPTNTMDIHTNPNCSYKLTKIE